MNFCREWLLKMSMVALIVWGGIGVALAQSGGRDAAASSAIKVDCNKKGSISSTLSKLSKNGMTRDVTIVVTGSCNENVLIQGFDRLTLTTTTGASITDPSGGANLTVDIEDSRSVTVQGFTINGGAEGVVCGNSSICYITGNTLQLALDSGVLVSAASTANLSSNVVQNNGRGLTVNLNSSANTDNDVFQGNAGSGITANQGYVFASTSTIQNNGSDGTPAILAGNHATLRLQSSTIRGNGGAGAAVRGGSEAIFDGTSVTGNTFDGVVVKDLSFANFNFSTNNITGNLGGIDVNCQPQFPATRGALTNIGGGITNCVEP